ncbi:hypothetical protein CR513_33675, partial [Mucuna pruriens]
MKQVETDSNIQEEAKTDFINLEQAEANSNIQDEVETDSVNLEEANRFQPGRVQLRTTESAFGRSRQSTPSTATQFVLPQSPTTELKPLPEHLNKHKKEIGWTLINLPRINPSICMHKIFLEEEARLIRKQ